LKAGTKGSFLKENSKQPREEGKKPGKGQEEEGETCEVASERGETGCGCHAKKTIPREQPDEVD